MQNQYRMQVNEDEARHNEDEERRSLFRSQFIEDEAGVCKKCCLWTEECECANDFNAHLVEGADSNEQEEDESSSSSVIGSPSDSPKMSHAGKRPISFDHEEERADLAAYFEEFDLTEQQQIAMCRTYANYLSQKVRAGLRGPAKRGRPAWGKPAARRVNFERDQE